MQSNQRNVYSLEKSQKEKNTVEELRKFGKRYNIDEIIRMNARDISVAQWLHPNPQKPD